jgi:stress response protein YsnF/sporulation protein YlmC with PRC-barrel domain
MPTRDWTDLIATDPHGEALGRVEDVYVDPDTGRPEFALVRQSKLGGLRHRNVLVPVHEARETGDALQVPYTAEAFRNAPDAGDRSSSLDPDGERRALEHFGEHRLIDEREGRAASVVLSEERLGIGRRIVDHERVRVRKVIVVEEVTVKVQLRREELEVVREPLEGAAGEVAHGVATDDRGVAEVGDELPPDLVLYGEEPVITTRVVPREQVRFSRHVVTDRVTIQETLRHEEAGLRIHTGDDERLGDRDVPLDEPGRSVPRPG